MSDLSEVALSALARGGKTGLLIRRFDWASTPLGPIEGWPLGLLTLVNTVVHASAPIALLWGPQGITFYNDEFAPLTGSHHPLSLGHAARGVPSRSRYYDRVLDICLTGDCLCFKNQPLERSLDGTTDQILVDLDYCPVTGEDGKPAGVLVQIARAPPRASKDLHSRTELDRLRNMFEQAPGFMAMFEGPDHVCKLANPTCIELIGHRKIIGMTVRDALPEIAFQGFPELLDHCYRTGEPQTGYGISVQLQRNPDAPIETRFVDYVYQPIRDGHGIVSGIFVQGSDVTARMTVDAALRESEARFRDVANAAPVLIWIADTTRSAIWFNASWYNFTGRAPERELGFGWLENVHPDDKTMTASDYAEAFDRRETFHLTYRLKRRDDEWRYVYDTGVPRFLPDGTFVGYIGSCVDVTEAQLAKAELRRFTERLEARVEERTTELAAANRELLAEITERRQVEDTLRQLQRLEAVGQLTSGVAHDFNNLLTVVLGNIEFLERDLTRAGVGGKSRERLNRMKDAAERGAKLTAQLLAFARRQHLEAKPANLNAIIGNMRNLLQSSVGGSFGLNIILDPSLWNALVDTTQVELVILNLAINGRDAMSTGGLLTIRTANVTVGQPDRPDAPPAGDYVRISVSDNGTGMSPNVLAKAYEPFFTTKSVGKGSGLGLAQVLGFAKQSGGGVRIDTCEGAGTLVSVFLPRSAREVEVSPVEKRTAEIMRLSGDSRTVLLVDDDDDVREVSASILRELGCTVFEADCGGAALYLLANSAGFDLLVVDLAMPDMTGVDVTRAVNAQYPDIPSLYVTGYADISALSHVGEDRIVKKPFQDDEFITKVKRLLSAHAVSDSPPGARLAGE